MNQKGFKSIELYYDFFPFNPYVLASYSAILL